MVNANDAESLLADIGPDAPANPVIDPPRRGRGRPRKDGSSPASATSTPKRGSAARLSVNQIADKLRAGFTLLAGALYPMLPEEYKPYSLREDEIEPLSTALAAEIQMNEKAYAMLTKAAGYSPHIALITVAASMVMTRVNIYQMLQQQQAAQQTRFDPPARPEPVRNDIPQNGNNPVSAWPGIQN